MKTLVIKIGQRNGPDYPLSIYSNADVFLGSEPGQWLKVARASTAIPAELIDPPAPAELAAPLAGAVKPESTWTAALVRQTLLEQSGASADFKKIGAWLYSLLNRGDVGTEWASLRKQFPGSQMRTFFDVEPTELARLPWELVFDRPNVFFQEAAMCRGAIQFGAEPLEDVWPLRVLIVVGSKENDTRVAADAEVEGIEDALREMGRKVYWEVLRRPTREKLRGELKDLRPHIFHFIGHGDTSAANAGGEQPGEVESEDDEAYLELFDSQGDRWEWSVDQIMTDLDPKWAPQFAFLNACHSSNLALSQAAWSVAGAFLERVPAVLGMQASASGVAAALLAARFYKGIADGESMELALREARVAVSDQFPDTREWCLGALSLKIPPELVLRLKPELSDERRVAVAEAIDTIKAFVGRRSDRREIWRALDPLANSTGGGRLIFVEGEDDVGTTQLVRSCTECCALRGRSVVEVTFDKQTSYGFLEVLRKIRESVQNAHHVFSAHLHPEEFAYFDHVVQHGNNGALAPKPGPGVPLAADDGRPWQKGDKRRISEVFGAFNQCLSESAGDVPLILVLDGLTVTIGEEEFWRNWFLGPLRSGSIRNVRAVVILRKEGAGSFGATMASAQPPLRVEPFPQDEFIPLATEYLRFHQKKDGEWREIIEAYHQKKGPAPWKPGRLKKMLEFIEG